MLVLPELVYLVFPEFEPFALAYPAFAVFKLPLLVPMCVCLAIVIFGCLALVSPIGSVYELLVLVYLLYIVPLADLISSLPSCSSLLSCVVS